MFAIQADSKLEILNFSVKMCVKANTTVQRRTTLNRWVNPLFNNTCARNSSSGFRNFVNKMAEKAEGEMESHKCYGDKELDLSKCASDFAQYCQVDVTEEVSPLFSCKMQTGENRTHN